MELHRYDFPITKRSPNLYLSWEDKEVGKNFFRAKGLTAEERSRVVVVHPGSGSKKKVWPLERFLDLVRYLQRHSGSRVLIVLGPAESMEVQKVFQGIEWDMGPVAPILAKGLPLLELASVMHGCRLFIGNDSGITHMAAALGLPTVALFGPTDDKIWAPKGEKVLVVRKQISCSPCSQEKFVQCQNLECLKGIEMGDLLKAFESLGFQFGQEGAA
jgi:ADP-heptose:LPS heptosyltransferase